MAAEAVQQKGYNDVLRCRFRRGQAWKCHQQLQKEWGSTGLLLVNIRSFIKGRVAQPGTSFSTSLCVPP
jgi:hypothetical protein